MGWGDICGALTGAYMLLGFKFHKEADQGQARYSAYDLVRELTDRFKACHGTIICRELLGVDLGTATGRKEAIDQGLFSTVCPRFVRDAAETVEALMRR
jgi:C_GCAxxG_C_C family probable redox protein